MFLFAISFGSCGGGGEGSSSSDSNNVSTAIIGPNGGSITSTDGKTTVQVPAGALTSDTTINIAIIEDNQGQVGSLYQVSGYGSADLVFLQPVTIKVKYDPNLLPTGTNEGSLQLALLEPFDSWEILTDSTVDEINQIISATTAHFSSIGILVNIPGGVAPKLIFPLPNRDPFNAAINSVFDHSMSKPYSADGAVKDYKEEVGNRDFCGCFTLKSQVLCEYSNSSGTSFIVNGNYAGGECGNVFLSYDGHPGYDYKTIDQDPANGQIDILAAADGIAHVPSSSEYGTIWIDHGNGYSTWYLHLSKRSITENQYVYKGNKIGVSGNIAPFYVGPHLHFEVRKNSVPIDPYAENLWEAVPIDTTPPSVPTGLTATAISSSQIDLSWNASSDDVGVAGYKIYDYYGTYLNSVTSTSTSITGLNSNTYYCFSVSAYDAVGNESGQSTQACATTQAPYSDPSDTTTTGITITVPNIDTSGGANNLQMYATVVIQNGTPLQNLTAGNFNLKETINGITKTVPITSVTTTSVSGGTISAALALDSSGSISSTELQDIKTAAKTFINNMGNNDYAAIIDFDSTVRVVQGFTNDKSFLTSAIDSLSSGGSTALYDAIYEAVTLTVNQSGYRAVVVMTDGQNNASSHSKEEVIDYAKSNAIPVYTIGMGNNVDETVLVEISDGTNAGSNGSGYYSAPTSADLTELYNNISKVLSNVYVIGWTSSGSKGDTVTAEVTVTYSCANGTFTDSFTSSYMVP